MINNRKISIYDLFIFILIIYVFGTFFSTLIPFLNKSLGIIVILVLLMVYFNHLTKRDLFILTIGIYYILISIYFHDPFSLFVEHTIHFVSTVLFLGKFTDKYFLSNCVKSVFKYKKLFIISLTLIGLINIVMVLLHIKYGYNTGNYVYIGFSNGSHTIASISCLCIMLIVFFRKYDLINANMCLALLMIYLAIVLSSGSRTYLGIILIEFVYYYHDIIKKYKYSKLILLFMVLLSTFVFFKSSIYERIVSTSNNQYISDNKLEAVSSGRLIWWKIDIDQFNKFTIYNKIVGKGNEFVFKTNKYYYGLYIWAHNDFIQVLVSYGLIGFIFYLVEIINIYKYTLYNTKNKFLSLCPVLAIFYIASVNGFYTQQHIIYCIFIMILIQFNELEIIGGKND